jgi:hypothetical protein
VLLGHLSPLARRDDGRWVMRNPLRSLAAVPCEPGLVAVISVLLGGTAFDGLSRTERWTGIVMTYGGSPSREALLGTIGLSACVALIALNYIAAMRSMPGGLGEGLEQRLAPSLLPIALGYVVAHYVSSVIFQGQAGHLLASDPFGVGWDLLGISGHSIDYTAVSAGTIALVQIAAIVIGHLFSVIAAHDQLIIAVPKQYPLLVVMVAYTVGGITLITGG